MMIKGDDIGRLKGLEGKDAGEKKAIERSKKSIEYLGGKVLRKGGEELSNNQNLLREDRMSRQ